MRKSLVFLLSVCLIFTSAHAISADISLSENIVGLNAQLTIDYSFVLDSSSEVNYVIKVGDLIILNETDSALSLSDVLEWNVANTAAGDYDVRLIVETLGGDSVSTSEGLAILRTPRIGVIGSDNLYMFGDSVEKNYPVSNIGNIPLETTAVPSGGFYSISNMAFNLGINETEYVSVVINKPESNRVLTITFTGVNQTDQVSLATEINVIVPDVNMSIESINYSVIGNETQFLIDVNNNGNILQDLNFTIYVTSMVGAGSFDHSESVVAGSITTLNFTIPSTDRVTKVEMRYIGSDGTVQMIEQRYDIIPGAGPLLDIFYTIWGSELLRGVVITIIILIILIFIWKVILKR